MNALGEQLRVLAGRNDQRVYLLNVITATTAVPSAEARTSLQRHFAAMRGKIIGAAIVMEKTGVEGTLSRAVLTTLLTITRQPFPMKLFAVRRDAAVWLNSRGCTASSVSLVSLVESLEQKLRASRAP
ncbi:MAG TPA: hypothetical protein VJV78_00125 [Polyangiales bacterium]|nr:hypothetical protein [Polyangiales bacterium]